MYIYFFTFKVCAPMGNNDMFSTVALNSSTLALIGPDPLLSGFISTCSLFSLSSSTKTFKINSKNKIFNFNK